MAIRSRMGATPQVRLTRALNRAFVLKSHASVRAKIRRVWWAEGTTAALAVADEHGILPNKRATLRLDLMTLEPLRRDYTADAKAPTRNPAPRARVRNPGCGVYTTDAEVRRRTVAEASTARGHRWFSGAHENVAAFCRANGYGSWATFHERMADSHRAMAHSLDALHDRKTPNPARPRRRTR